MAVGSQWRGSSPCSGGVTVPIDEAFVSNARRTRGGAKVHENRDLTALIGTTERKGFRGGCNAHQ